MSVSGQDSISLIKAVQAKGFDNMSTLIESSTENTDVLDWPAQLSREEQFYNIRCNFHTFSVHLDTEVGEIWEKMKKWNILFSANIKQTIYSFRNPNTSLTLNLFISLHLSTFLFR